ncbi:MAG: FAD-binding oxidoreductase [Deltaproteobacteria bacterium]|nr:FAD-binding oxidoreductase [Deltaproteobacteria bacterium]MBW2218245.1 FAD-binding oxidoreductase [Deltaproteobacteria bacterium]
MFTKQSFQPDWCEKPPKKKSYRSIFKWGNPNEFKHPNSAWYEMIKEEFGLTDEDFEKPQSEGNEKVEIDQKIKLPKKKINAFIDIVGEKNVSTDDYSRVKYSHGKTVDEAIELRRNLVRNVPDIIVHPRDKKDVLKIVKYCNKQKLPVYIFGGGSSVTFGLNTPKGGVMLAMGTHMNKLLSINEQNQTATMQPGIFGPAYEEALNNPPKRFNVERQYTCGHFPQSFEYSTVGGWVVTLGSGQASTYYGDAYDIVLSQEYVTPAGIIKTHDYPGTATGPKINDIMKGSEGSFGILVELTMKIFRHMPGNRQRFAFMFPSWDAAVEASREILQGEFGKPAVYRIADPEETEVGLKHFGVQGTPIDSLVNLRGFKPMKRCLCLGTVEGEKDFTKHVKDHIAKVCKQYGAMTLTGFATMLWEKTRYKEPYMREDLMDYGVIIDTVESAVTWDNLHRLHQGVRSYIKKRPGTICMTHASHFYPQGTNLYFIFILKMMDLKSYRKFHDGILDAILKHGGSISHHHGIGKLFAPLMTRHLGKEQMAVLRVLKNHFDPNNIMNPGGHLGLD